MKYILSKEQINIINKYVYKKSTKETKQSIINTTKDIKLILIKLKNKGLKMRKAVKIIRQVEIKKILDKDEVIETWINGKYETQKFAKAGEYIVIGSQGEEYSIDPETMKKRYSIKDNIATTLPVEIDFMYAEDDMTFEASWGQEMNVQKGDILVYENNKLSYGIALNAFNETYREII